MSQTQDEVPVEIRLKRKTQAVVIYDEDENRIEAEIRSLTGANRDRYMTEDAKRVKVSADGKTFQVNDLTDQQASLISMCLYVAGKQVKIEDIRQWPADAQEHLFHACRRLNGMTKEAEDDAKKA